MKILVLICFGGIIHAQADFAPWERYVNETKGFSILSSSAFSKNTSHELLNSDTLTIDTYSYSESFKGDELLSYITTYPILLPDDMDEEFSKDILYTSLEELAFSSNSVIVYENFKRMLLYDEIFFRMETSEGKALKGKFVMTQDRFYLIAMYYKSHIRLNKRANYFIESFEIVREKFGRDPD